MPRGSSKSSPTRAELNLSGISESEFSCHCCYDILVNPTTLTCGHNFCRHCLAQWWVSSRKNECPECREKWQGFPKINILLRDATDKYFREEVERRKVEIQANSKISRSLLAFQSYGDHLNQPRTIPTRGTNSFFSGVLTALTFVAALVLVYHWSSSGVEQHVLIRKPISLWTPEDVVSWLELLGPWAQLYKEAFQQENVNGRLLLMLGEEELLRSPYNITNQAHRRAVLAELDRAETLGIKPPQNLWEYKVAHCRMSVFLVYGLKRSPRLTIFYMYLFDYSESFLPFLHTCCPAVPDIEQSVESKYLDKQVAPSWQQWAEFLVQYFLIPYQLITAFAWAWLDVHYWTSRIIIIDTLLLFMLEVTTLVELWVIARLRTLPIAMWDHLCAISHGFLFTIIWPFFPEFLCSCYFYWALYFSPIITFSSVVRRVMYPAI